MLSFFPRGVLDEILNLIEQSHGNLDLPWIPINKKTHDPYLYNETPKLTGGQQ